MVSEPEPDLHGKEEGSEHVSTFELSLRNAIVHAIGGDTAHTFVHCLSTRYLP